jgi:hypothetical protein
MLLVTVGVSVRATQIPFRDLTNLVISADHVVIGKVVSVDMVNDKGQQVNQETARTGPGENNQLRLHIEVVNNGVLATTTNYPPKKILIPLWGKWHDTLENCRKETQGKTFIFLLKGTGFDPVYPGLFMRDKAERQAIENILEKKTPTPLVGQRGWSDAQLRQLATKYRDEWLAENKPEDATALAAGVIQTVEKTPQGWHITFVTLSERKPGIAAGFHDRFLHIYINSSGKLDRVVREPDRLS